MEYAALYSSDRTAQRVRAKTMLFDAVHRLNTRLARLLDQRSKAMNMPAGPAKQRALDRAEAALRVWAIDRDSLKDVCVSQRVASHLCLERR